jgi:hypothetical protein
MSALQNKTIVQLRGIAQSYDIPDIFSMDEVKLKQAIEIKQGGLFPEKKIEIPKPAYDSRLMTKVPGKMASQVEAEALLKPYMDKGLKVSFTQEQWFMSLGKKTDQGTMRMPLRHLVNCAAKLFEVSGG